VSIFVATLGVGLLASYLVAFLGSSVLQIVSCVGVAMRIVAALVVGCKCHVVRHTDDHVSLNIREKKDP
jgi:hypothetical protein